MTTDTVSQSPNLIDWVLKVSPDRHGLSASEKDSDNKVRLSAHWRITNGKTGKVSTVRITDLESDALPTAGRHQRVGLKMNERRLWHKPQLGSSQGRNTP